MNEIVFLPIAKNDLKEIATYISPELHVPMAAEALYREIAKHISNLILFPLCGREYEPIAPLLDQYRIMPVKNYVVLYVVHDGVVEIRRIIDAKMDYEKLIKKISAHQNQRIKAAETKTP